MVCLSHHAANLRYIKSINYARAHFYRELEIMLEKLSFLTMNKLKHSMQANKKLRTCTSN